MNSDVPAIVLVDSPMVLTPPVSVARVGWMCRDHNIRVGDKSTGGGTYKEEYLGSEIANFFPWQGRVYGFFRTPEGSRLKFRRSAPTARDARGLKGGVRVTIVATPRESGQDVVGLYRSATTFAEPRRGPPHPEGSTRWHKAIAGESDAQLPIEGRTLQDRRGPGGVGSNAKRFRSPFSGRGQPADLRQ